MAEATPTEPWPLWSVEANGGKAYLLGETPKRLNPWHDERIEELVTAPRPRPSAIAAKGAAAATAPAQEGRWIKRGSSANIECAVSITMEKSTT